MALVDVVPAEGLRDFRAVVRAGLVLGEALGFLQADDVGIEPGDRFDGALQVVAILYIRTLVDVESHHAVRAVVGSGSGVSIRDRVHGGRDE